MKKVKPSLEKYLTIIDSVIEYDQSGGDPVWCCGMFNCYLKRIDMVLTHQFSSLLVRDCLGKKRSLYISDFAKRFYDVKSFKVLDDLVDFYALDPKKG